MSIAAYLGKLAQGLSSQGILGPAKGGTGVSSPGATGNVLVSDGTNWTSQNIPLGATGPTGPGGLGFTIAKTYASVAALTADTAPTGITAGQFALIDTGDTNNAENSRLYVWTGSVYTYTSDLSGAQGIVGPTGAQGTNGTIGVNGTTGPTGPTGPAGTAATGGASFYTGDVVLSANAAQYTTPTWIQAQGQMFDTGTYPGLDTLYGTNGSYDGIATQISQAVPSGSSTPISFTTLVSHNQGVHDPVTGDYYYHDGVNEILVIGRDSSGNYIQSANSLMSVVNSNISASTVIRFNISPDGMVFAIQQAANLYVFKRNTSGVEASTGVRFVLIGSILAPNWMGAAAVSTNYPVNLHVTNAYWICAQASGYQGFIQANLNTNSLDYQQTTAISSHGTYNTVGQSQAINPVNHSMVMTVNDSSTTSAKIWTLSGNTWSNTVKTLISSGSRYNKILWAADGTAVYVGRLGTTTIEIYSHDGSGNIASVGTIAGTNAASMNNMAMSASGTYIACGYATSPFILLFKRDTVGGYTYTQTASSPQNASQTAGVNDIFFDPKFNILGATTIATPFAPRFWIGATKTILPNMGIPAKNLKYYIKTGS